MKKLLFIFALLSIFGACTVSEKTSLNFEDYSSCYAATGFVEGSNEPLAYQGEDGSLMGQFELVGPVLIRQEQAPFRESEELVDVVYLDPVNYTREMGILLYGTPHNKTLKEEGFFFKLGFINADEDLESSAEIINPEIILDALETGDSVTLNMNIVSQLGHGGYEGSVLPCVIVVD